MAKISYITTSEEPSEEISLEVPMDESVGALLIDISGFKNPFSGYPQLYNNFGNSQVQCISGLDDASLLGITNNSFLNGLLYYHVSQFYKFVGESQFLYIVLADCSKNWDIIPLIQQEAAGRIFQIGVWTHQKLWERNDTNNLIFSSLVFDLQRQAEEVNGVVGKVSASATPLNIILFGNSNYVDGNSYTYKEIPDASALNCPKVSVVLAQNGTSQVHDMQSKMPDKAPVSVAGLFLACLAVCGAEKSVASTLDCDLNKSENFTRPEWGFGKNHLPISDIYRNWANIISERGYIIPIDYEALEGQYFFSSDQTLSHGDYRTISNNRIMHKCRRAIMTALYPYVHGNLPASNGKLDTVSISILQDKINTLLDTAMLNKEGLPQISSKSIAIMDKNLLQTDSISIEMQITPVNSSESITEQVSDS